jgi:hypothetical protein
MDQGGVVSNEKSVPDEHWRDYLDPPKYVKAFQLRGKDAVVTIARVVRGTVEMGTKKSQKAMIYIVGKDLPIVAGATVLNTIASLYGKSPQAWVGKRITIYGATTNASGGDTVECLRVRPVAPPAPKTAPVSEEYTPPKTPAEELADSEASNERA